ncbi:uncharacterized protein V1518DRAFT_407837, partial [Limtongia smithiae]|uniref:uncharacterized protein n=1 Tax=Limtongia smithiae TaxID=1125753 RepID=UPI0034CD53A1
HPIATFHSHLTQPPCTATLSLEHHFQHPELQLALRTTVGQLTQLLDRLVYTLVIRSVTASVLTDVRALGATDRTVLDFLSTRYGTYDFSRTVAALVELTHSPSASVDQTFLACQHLFDNVLQDRSPQQVAALLLLALGCPADVRDHVVSIYSFDPSRSLDLSNMRHTIKAQMTALSSSSVLVPPLAELQGERMDIGGDREDWGMEYGRRIWKSVRCSGRFQESLEYSRQDWKIPGEPGIFQTGLEDSGMLWTIPGEPGMFWAVLSCNGLPHPGYPEGGDLTTVAARVSPSVICYRCGKPGHLRKSCRVKLPAGSAVPGKGSPGTSSSSGPSGSATGWIGLHASTDSLDIGSHFYFDSGANHHVVSDKSLFTTFAPVTSSITGLGGAVPVLGRGTVHIKLQDRAIILHDCLYVPSCVTNLISLSRVISAGSVVQFTKTAILIDSAMAGKLDSNGLFRAHVSPVTPPTVGNGVQVTGWLCKVAV